MTKDDQIKLTEELVETAYKLLTHKLAFGGLIAKNEAAFQLEFGYILKSLGQLYEFRLDDKFHLEFETYIKLAEKSKKSKSNNARVDILIRYEDENSTTKTAIELKFFKKENHREPNNRYDVFKDISNIEMYKRNNIDLCYFILATDHTHYVKGEYSSDTANFDFSHKKSYKAGTTLQYKTAKPYGEDIILERDYNFLWNTEGDKYSFLKIKI